MPISLKDIARMANVSTATVSRVINDKAIGASAIGFGNAHACADLIHRTE